MKHWNTYTLMIYTLVKNVSCFWCFDVSFILLDMFYYLLFVFQSFPQLSQVSTNQAHKDSFQRMLKQYNMNYWLKRKYSSDENKRCSFIVRNNCQAQFKFSTSSVQFELRLSLQPGYYHPTPPGKVEIQQLLDYLGHWNLVWKL